MPLERCQPDRIKIGASVVLLSLNGLAESWGIREEGVRRLLDILGLKRIRLPGGSKWYVGLYPLETALFELSAPDSWVGVPGAMVAAQELAGVMYGAVTREVLMARAKELVKVVKTTRLTRRRSKARIKR